MSDSNVTLKQIEAFYWAANLGSFSIAAGRLHVTQSSLSKRIQELEDAVGVELFERSGRRAQLTERGQRLVPVARQMLELRGELKAALMESPRLTGTCRFGVSELASLTWLPELIRVVRADHPDLVLQPYVDLARNLERRVVKGELDFCVAPGPADNASVQGKLVGRVDFSWIASPSRLAAGSVLTADELRNHPVITMTEGSGLTRAFDAWAAEQGLQVQRTLACNSLMAIVGLTAADMGISFLPTYFMRPWIQQGSLVCVHGDPPLPSLGYYFLQRADDHRDMLGTMLTYVMRVADFTSPINELALAVDSTVPPESP
jgi:DNA-binding transcriptional LysR family regulator